MFSSWHNALRAKELSDEEMANTTCTCPENPDLDEFCSNSYKPCLSWEPDNTLECKKCIYRTNNK